MSIRIGSVPFMNARPLVRWFGTDEGKRSGFELVEAPPTQLARMLEEGEITLALTSSFALFQHPDYRYVPGISIAGLGAIKSVRAFSRLPFGMIHSCAMDTSSLTSVALLTILLDEVYNSHPQKLSLPPDLPSMLDQADAALLIGDPGLLADGRGMQTLDLGEAWRKHTRLPFVYALWIGKQETITRDVIDTLQTAKEYGLTKFNEIAQEEAERLNCPQALCYQYVSEVLNYDLGEEHLQGLDLFHEKCRQHALLSESGE